MIYFYFFYFIFIQLLINNLRFDNPLSYNK